MDSKPVLGAEYMLRIIEEEKSKLEKLRSGKLGAEARMNTHVVFDIPTWRHWLEGLSPYPLSVEQAGRLLTSLATFCTPNPEAGPSFVGPGLIALHEAFTNFPELRDYVAQWSLPSEPAVSAFNDSIGLPRYLESENLAADVTTLLKETTAATANAVGVDLLRDGASFPMLPVLYDLRQSSHAYSALDLFEEMGLSADNTEPLERFFEFMARTVKEAEQTDMVTDSLSNIEANRILQIKYSLIVDKMKRRQFKEFAFQCEKLQNFQTQVYKKQCGMLGVRKEYVHSEAETESLTHQVDTLEALHNVRETIFRCLNFFAERELVEGIKLIDGLMPIHHQMTQVCDNSVALIYIGLMKTGKSTLVDTLIGDNVAPSRMDPMTAIPVRYVHDPHATQPVMLVPFSSELNRVVRAIRKVINERGKTVFIPQLRLLHLKALAEKIADGNLAFETSYTGAQEILAASFALHDLFRLAVQSPFPPSLALDLPLTWNQGLDSFLTISTKFPDSFGVSPHVRLSIIDTPGVDESGVKKLNLNQVIIDAVDVCHYVAFTVDALRNQSNSNVVLKQLVCRIAATTHTPNMVLATRLDEMTDPEKIEDTRINIANSLNESAVEYPRESVFFVSSKRKFLGDRMLAHLNRMGTKPALDDPDERARKLANDWSNFASFGLDAPEKKGYYQRLQVSELRERCEKMVVTSNMKLPMDEMIFTATTNASILTSNKAIEKTLQACNQVIPYLKGLLTATEADAHRVEDLTAICNEVSANIDRAVSEIRGGLRRKAVDFGTTLRKDIDKALSTFLREAPTFFEESSWNFGGGREEDAIDKAKEVAADLVQHFAGAIHDLFETKRAGLENNANAVEAEVVERIFRQLDRIYVEETEGIDPSYTLPQAKSFLTLDDAKVAFVSWVETELEKTMARTSCVRQGDMGGYVVDLQDILATAKKPFTDACQSLNSAARYQVERSLARYVDILFTQALRKITLAGAALAQREILTGTSDNIRELLATLMGQARKLEELVRVPKRKLDVSSQ